MSSMRLVFSVILLQSLSLVSIAGPATGSALDPEADRILKIALDNLKSAASFSFHSEVSYEEVLPSGKKVVVSKGGNLLLKRPGQFFVKMENQDTHTQIFFSEGSMTIYDEMNHFYTEVELQESIDAAIDEARDKFDFRAPHADLMVTDPYANLIEKIEVGYYLGLNYYEGDYYHQLLLSNDIVDAQLWITDSEQPVIRAFIITYKQLPAAPQFRSELSNWNFNPSLNEDSFKFYPPEDAVRIDALPISYSVQ